MGIKNDEGADTHTPHVRVSEGALFVVGPGVEVVQF
jgi:hypothetical protein